MNSSTNSLLQPRALTPLDHAQLDAEIDFRDALTDHALSIRRVVVAAQRLVDLRRMVSVASLDEEYDA
jgi:hypothetical protein